MPVAPALLNLLLFAARLISSIFEIGDHIFDMTYPGCTLLLTGLLLNARNAIHRGA